ncbi:YgaP-like transmembrane domain [Granulicoccus phenolivorans]|uniref:YgaP-like transmembrane domain n=1 Tax=Granulicoccus phenolivorans TaxID=266854 RepID=UPI0004175FED|nr:YgaP-like transmembrane domain [Granulicoccus phenolivorans]
MTCASSRTQRVVRGIVALFMVAYAVSTLPTAPVLGIAAAVIAIGIAVSAVTGACLTNPLQLRGKQEPTSFGFDDARKVVDLSTPSSAPTTANVEQRGCWVRRDSADVR